MANTDIAWGLTLNDLVRLRHIGTQKSERILRALGPEHRQVAALRKDKALADEIKQELANLGKPKGLSTTEWRKLHNTKNLNIELSVPTIDRYREIRGQNQWTNEETMLHLLDSLADGTSVEGVVVAPPLPLNAEVDRLLGIQMTKLGMTTQLGTLQKLIQTAETSQSRADRIQRMNAEMKKLTSEKEKAERDPAHGVNHERYNAIVMERNTLQDENNRMHALINGRKLLTEQGLSNDPNGEVAALQRVLKDRDTMIREMREVLEKKDIANTEVATRLTAERDSLESQRQIAVEQARVISKERDEFNAECNQMNALLFERDRELATQNEAMQSVLAENEMLREANTKLNEWTPEPVDTVGARDLLFELVDALAGSKVTLGQSGEVEVEELAPTAPKRLFALWQRASRLLGLGKE